MTDFFISYTKKDEDWAEWVGYALEAKGFKIIIQAWDIPAGSNFVIEMQKAANTAMRTILILSPDFLKSDFTAPEWAAAFAQDPQGLDQRLVPVMVRECEPGGLLKAVVQIRLVGLEESAARDKLLRGVDRKRAKPSNPPPFPGGTTIKPPKSFPGSNPSEPPKNATGDGIPVKLRKNGLFVTMALAAAGALGLAVLTANFSKLGKGVKEAQPVLAGYDSPKMGGGHTEEEQCRPLRDKYASDYPNFNITVSSSQDSDKDMLGHVTYHYHCQYSATPK